MAHTIEHASSGRAKCRGCGQTIAKDDLRVGERLPNPFASEGDMTLWYHPRCVAYKRPEVFLEVVETPGIELHDKDELTTAAKLGAEHRRLPRVDGAQRAPSGRARCRSCRDMIEKDVWRIPVVYYEEGRFNPSGFIHASCSASYLGTTDVIDRIKYFAPALTAEELDEIRKDLGA